MFCRLVAGIENDLVVVTETYIHPLYDSTTGAYDLAVVETHEEIPFSPKVGPACLPFRYMDKDFVGDTVKVLGKCAAYLSFSLILSVNKVSM